MTVEVVPVAGSLISLLQKCRHHRNLLHARRLLAYMERLHLHSDPILGNYLVPMLAECGALHDAQRIFDQLPHRNEHSWRSLLSGYINCGDSQLAFLVYQRMREDFIRPASHTYVALLKACARSRDAHRGQELHADIVKYDGALEQDLFVGNTLVDMYGKSGLLLDAHRVLDKLFIQDTVSWNALISGYAEHGFHRQVRNFFQEMQLLGVAPDGVTLVCSLKTCGTVGALETGQELHTEITKRGFEEQLEVANTLVDMYGKCCSLSEAHHVFDKLLVRDPISWTALISGYVDGGLGEQALDCVEQFQVESICPDGPTFVSSLRACGLLGTTERGQVIHTEIVKRGLEMKCNVGTTLVDMYTKCASHAEAQEVFNSLQARDAVAWVTLISAQADNGKLDAVMNSMKQLHLEGVLLVPEIFTNILKSCGVIRAVELGKEIHSEVLKKGLEGESSIGIKLVEMYAKCGLLVEAQNSFERSVKDAVSWTLLISGYTEAGLGCDALSCYKQMELEGLSPIAETFSWGLKACAIIEDLEIARDIHTEVVKRGLERDLHIGTTLLDTLAKCGSLAEAQGVFTKLPVHDEVSWTALIAGYSDCGFGVEALVFFEKMQLECILPNANTFACSLKACGIVNALESGQNLHSKLTERGFEGDSFVSSSMIDMYGVCGSLAEAQDVFSKVSVRDVTTWNAMIKGYGENHDVNLAVQYFENMQEQGVKPNAVTFTCLLSACSHASMILMGHEYFKLMKDEQKIEPTKDHYVCMVDLFARSGHIHDAEKIAKDMQCLLAKEVLMVLLSACKIHCKVELGLTYFRHLVQLNQDDAAAYLLMAEIYGTAGQWAEANRIEDMRRRMEANKKPANSLIELKKTSHKFVVNVNQTTDILAVLQTLRTCIQREGYVPSLDLVLASTT